MQSTRNIFLVKPTNFGFNTETAISNSFQNEPEADVDSIEKKVSEEFDQFVKTLDSTGVRVHVFDDNPKPEKPDAIFPNNWISTHADGRVILYPMNAPNRRTERRQEIIDRLDKEFIISEIIDLSSYENKNQFLEGTGSVVFDHDHRAAYACLSPRTDKELLFKVCDFLSYKPICFYAYDEAGKEIYHTNVMMCIGAQFSVICLESITDKMERQIVEDSLKQSGHEVLDISRDQMTQFAGNMLQVKGSGNRNILALSLSAFNCLDTDQKSTLEKYVSLVPLNVQTIESVGGGSVRCMIAEIFLPEREK